MEILTYIKLEGALYYLRTPLLKPLSPSLLLCFVEHVNCLRNVRTVEHDHFSF